MPTDPLTAPVPGADRREIGGVTIDIVAPAAVVIDPGHDGWVEGDEAAILIEFDFLENTAKRFGLPDAHRH
jgi:hypothetical protein